MSSNAAAQAAMHVPLLDLKAQYASLQTEIQPIIAEVCASQWFILGPNVKQLEAEIAAYSQCEYGVGVSSGTDALLLALMALDIGAGDEVLTTPYSFFATAGVVARLGARPVFCDIDERTYNLSAATVQAFIDTQCDYQGGCLINKQTGGQIKVLMPVHLYGQVADMQSLLAIAKRYGLRIVEDAAQAIGAESDAKQRAGSMGDIGCFSFFPSKNLGAFGDAGMCVTRDQALAEKMRILRVHGSKPKYYHAMVGGNFRLDELQAAVLRIKLKYLDSWSEARQKNAAYYTAAFSKAGLDNQVITPVVQSGYRHIYNQYVIRVQQRDELRKYLQEHNIGTEIYYPVSLHVQECFANLGYKANDCAESQRASDETLALPIYPELSEVQLQYVADTIISFYR